MGTVTGKFKMRTFKFSIFFCAYALLGGDALAKDLEILGVETILRGDYRGRSPEVEIRVRLKSVAQLPIDSPRGVLTLTASEGRLQREIAQLIPRIEPGFEMDTTLRFEISHWWAAAEPTLRFELLDYRVNEALAKYLERLRDGTKLGEAVVAASLGLSSPACERWAEPGFIEEAQQYVREPNARYLSQSEGFLRLALILGLRYCRPEESIGLRAKLGPSLHASLDEVLQILVSNLDAKGNDASPLAQALPSGTRTLADLFEKPLSKTSKESLTVRYGGAAASPSLDTSSSVALEGDVTFSPQYWVMGGLIAALALVLFNRYRRREK